MSEFNNSFCEIYNTARLPSLIERFNTQGFIVIQMEKVKFTCLRHFLKVGMYTALFITDRSTGNQFLVDTGADVSLVKLNKSSHMLYAANNSTILTYGTA
ncbi:hypothetical protein FF38_13484 [Lucilia cuprina]|uniref:Peptidase A2 domain-containing protein n=1 Tax=Lucilia cuprina TaxID=7375 RepID=A0A0L0C7S5_LUCCU|nr:hypothetical protein FF38_13484 [Lucilia cuprina]